MILGPSSLRTLVYMVDNLAQWCPAVIGPTRYLILARQPLVYRKPGTEDLGGNDG